MKLLVIAQRVPYPPNKGEKIRTYHQIEWLCAQGHDVALAVPIESDQDAADLNALAEHLGIATHSARLRLKAWRLGLGFLRGRSLSEANFASRDLARQITELLVSGDFDGVFLCASSLLPYVQLALTQADVTPQRAKMSSLPIYMDFMDLDSDKWQQYSQRSGFPMRWLYQREAAKVAQLEFQAARICQACFFIAQAEIDLFKQKVPQAPVYSLGNGIDTKAFHPADKGLREDCVSGPVLLFVGAMDYTPNVDAVCWFVTDAWPQVRKNHPGARFIIGGMNPSSAVQALTRYDGVEVTGFVEEILPYFHQADIFVAPFRLARGVQNKVLQAFACGLPTITTPMGAEGIDCVAQVHYVPAESTSDFVREIQGLLGNFARRKALGDAAAKLILDHYSWDAQLAVLGDHLQGANR